jgi:hypothetical protein
MTKQDVLDFLFSLFPWLFKAKSYTCCDMGTEEGDKTVIVKFTVVGDKIYITEIL